MNSSLFRGHMKGIISLATIVMVFTILIWVACTDKSPTEITPVTEQAVLSLSNPEVQKVMNLQDAHTAGLMSNQDIIGTATGLDENGHLAIIVFVNMESQSFAKTAATVPAVIDKVPVVVELTDPFRALKVKPPTVDHKAKQTPPIKLGTSGGWRYDLANGYCCGGTLGALVQGSGKKYILSNYHVFTADIVPGGNNRIAQLGDYVIQPGLIDVNCTASNAQNVATLSSVNTLPDANVDAAIAEIIAGMVAENGEILEVGTLSASTVAAALNQAVKKSGRTTGLTRSSVSGLNATVSVTYDNECAGGTAFTKTFTGQIIIQNKASRFLASGDSGSLMVEDVTTNPRAVGLLYAGSTSTAVANPINAVLSFFGVTMVGN